MRRLLKFAALGAVLVYFFRDRIGRPGRLGRVAKSQAFDVKQKVKDFKEDAGKAQPDDVTLARKVETEIFRSAEVPKGQINVNAENGVVVLRGEVEEPKLIRDLEEKTRNVQGVQEVENLLHTPGTPAPAQS
jgi:osmotically-inducible protein OsmY